MLSWWGWRIEVVEVSGDPLRDLPWIWAALQELGRDTWVSEIQSNGAGGLLFWIWIRIHGEQFQGSEELLATELLRALRRLPNEGLDYPNACLRVVPTLRNRDNGLFRFLPPSRPKPSP